MPCPQIYKRITLKQFHKFKTILLEHLVQNLLIKIIFTKHTDLTFKILHVLDHAGCGCLVHCKLILLHAKLLHCLHKGFHCKSIMLSGNTEFLTGLLVNVFGFQQSKLLRHLTGIA